MATDKVSSKVGVDLVLTPGKVVGKEDLTKLLIKQLNSIDLPPTKIKPVFKYEKGNLDKITQQMRGVVKEIDDALNPEITTTGHLANLPEKQLRQVRSTFQQMDKLARSRDSLRKFDSKEFQQAFQAFYAGEIKDPKTGKMREVNEATINSLKDLRSEAGKPIFTNKTVDRIRQYKAEYKQLQKELIRTEEMLRNIRSQNVLKPLPGTDARPVVGQAAGRPHPKQSSLALGEAEVMRQTLSGIDKNLLTPAQMRKREEQIERRSRAEARAKEVEARREAASAARQARNTQSLRERVSQAAEIKRGRGVLAKGRVKELKDIKQLESAMVALNAQKKINEQTQVRIDNQKGGAAKERVDRLKNSTVKLNGELKEAKTLLRQLQSPPKTTPRKPLYSNFTPITAGVPQRPNTVVAGEAAFRKSGGFGGTFSVPKENLRDVSAYHKERIASLTEEQAKLSRTSKTFRKDYDKMGKAIFNHGRDLEHAKERMQSFGSATQQTSSLFRQFFRYALGYGALYQVLAAVRALAGGIVELDTALKGIQAVTQATNEEMRLIETGIKGVALETQFNAKEIAEAAQILGQAGVIPQELPSALRATALFASATGSAIALSADLVTSMRNVFTTLSDQSIANQLTQAINISKLTAADLKTVISLSSQIAKSYSLTADQYLAAVTTLRNAGIKPSTVATGLRQGLIEIFSPDSKTVKALKTRYAQLGEQLSSSEVRDKFFSFQLEGNPLIAALRELQRLGFTGEGQKVFQRAYDIRAENAISALINNLEEVEASSAKLTFGNAAMQAAQTQMEALSHSFSNMNAAISVFAHDLTGGAVGGLESLADKITDVVRGLTDMNLQLQVMRGNTVWLQAIAGIIGGVAGLKYFKGGIPGKAIVGSAFAYTGASIANKSTGVDAENEKGATEAVRSFWEFIQDTISTLLPALGAVLSVELFNKLRGKGSPLLESLFSRFKKAPPVVAEAAAASTQGKTGFIKATPAITKGATAAASTAGALGTLFSNKIWTTLKSKIGFVLKFLKGHPILLALTALQIGLPFIGKLFDSISGFFDPKGIKKLDTRFKAAIKRRDRATVEYENLLKSQEEFRFSSGTYKAKAGTTAASIELMEKNLNEYTAELGSYFGKNAEDVEGLTALLQDFITAAPEAGTKASEEAYRNFQAEVDKRQVSTDITDSQIRNLAAKGRLAINNAESMRDSISKLITNLSERADQLGASDQAYLQAFKTLTSGDLATQNLIFGPSLGDKPLAAAESLNKFSRRFLEEQQRLFKLTDEYKNIERTKLQTDSDSIRLLLDKIRTAPNREAMLEAIDGWGTSLSSLTDEGIAYLNQQIEALNREKEAIAAKREGKAESRTTLAQAKALLKEYNVFADVGSRPLPQDSGETVQRLREFIDNEEKRLGSRKSRRDDARDLERQVAADIALRKLEEDKAAAVDVRTAAQEKVNKKFLSDAEVFYKKFISPEADEKNRASLQRTIVDRGERGELGTMRDATERLAALFEKGELEVVIKPGPEGHSTIPPEFLDVLDVGDRLSQQRLDEDTEYARVFNDLNQYKKIIAAESAIDLAKKAKDFESLSTSDELNNLYRIWERLKIADLHNRITHLQQQPITSDAEEDKRDKEIFDLEQKQAKVRQDAEDGINKALIDQANSTLTEFKKSKRRQLEGLKKQRAIAIDSGDIVAANDLDKQILAIKREILTYEIQRLVALKRAGEVTEQDIIDFVEDSKQDLVPELQKPAAARTIGSRIAVQTERDFPIPPDLSKDPTRHGYLTQQGKLTTAEARNQAREARINALLASITEVESQIADITALPSGEQNAQTLAVYDEIIKRQREEIGRLRGEQQDEAGFIEGAGYQVQKGFDLGNVSAAIDESESSISNLGDTIQDDLVGGLDNVADGFANALVEGENLTDGLKTAFSDMFKQIAADMIKSGVLSFFSTVAGSGIASFFGGAAKGGVIEAKAAGGTVGGGTIRGPGTGTSDSVSGAVVDGRGRVTRGIRVSNGEGILTARAMRGIGSGLLNLMNTSSESTLKAIRRALTAEGYRGGGIPSPVSGLAVSGALNGMSMAPMRFATGGVVEDASGTTKSMTGMNKTSTTTHNFQANVNIEAGEDTGLTPDDLRRLDDGINLKIQEYVEEQMRPGGVLQSARGR